VPPAGEDSPPLPSAASVGAGAVLGAVVDSALAVEPSGALVEEWDSPADCEADDSPAEDPVLAAGSVLGDSVLGDSVLVFGSVDPPDVVSPVPAAEEWPALVRAAAAFAASLCGRAARKRSDPDGTNAMPR